MSELATRMEAIKDSLAAAYPARVVTRSLQDPALIDHEDLQRGVYTVVSLAERNYTNVAGYEAQDGAQRILILGDFVIQENQPGSKIEDTEFTMIEEVKAWCRALPAELCLISLLSVSQSGQTANPYGWIVCEAEYRP